MDTDEERQAVTDLIVELKERIAALEARNDEVKAALPSWADGPGIVGAVLHMKERIAEQQQWIDDAVANCAKRECATRDRRIAALEAEREKDAEVVLATAKATDDLAAQNVQQRERIAALEALQSPFLEEARREGARRALEWFVRQPRGDDSVGWVLTKSYDQMIDAALGEVDGG